MMASRGLPEAGFGVNERAGDTPRDRPLVYEMVRDAARFAELESAWHDAWHRNSAHVFQSYEWISHWWKLQSGEFHLHIAVAWRGAEIAALLPFVVHHWRGARLLEWAAQSVSDYCDAIGGPEFVLEQLWQLSCQTGGFNIIRLKSVRPDATIRPVFSRVLGFAERSDDVCLRAVRRWPNGQAWYRSLNKKKRNNDSRGRRILESMGGDPNLQPVITTASPELIARLLEMKRQWLQANNLKISKDIEALPTLVQALEKLGTLAIFTLRRDDQVVAGMISAIQGGKMAAIFASYDYAVQRASPGTMLMADYTRWAFDHGIDEIDYLRGDEAYKFEFANEKMTLSAYMAGCTLVGKCLLIAHRHLKRWTEGPQRQEHEMGSAYFTKAGNPRRVDGAHQRREEGYDGTQRVAKQRKPDPVQADSRP